MGVELVGVGQGAATGVEHGAKAELTVSGEQAGADGGAQGAVALGAGADVVAQGPEAVDAGLVVGVATGRVLFDEPPFEGAGGGGGTSTLEVVANPEDGLLDGCGAGVDGGVDDFVGELDGCGRVCCC